MLVCIKASSDHACTLNPCQNLDPSFHGSEKIYGGGTADVHVQKDV